MFTGIIEATARVQESGNGCLSIERPKAFSDIRIGNSIAVAGVCLTIKKLNKKCIQFDVVSETLRRTTLGLYKEGDTVNLERAMKADGRLDGHIVQGHVEGIGEVVSVSTSSPRPPPPENRPYPSIPRPLPPREEGGAQNNGWIKESTPKNILLYARTMRKNPTEAEEVLWKRLRNDALGARFRRQYPLGGRILDFYAPIIRLGIEVDGGIHLTKEAQEDDSFRSQYLADDHHVSILRFSNKEILEHTNHVVSKINAYIQKHTHSLPPVEEGLGMEGPRVEMNIAVPSALLQNIIPKGSITIDGVSLTVAHIQDNEISIALIPHTIENTTLGILQKGDQVNIETDILARYAQKQKA
ncbi:MAG: riboflavin synthase [Candidatus Peregrinibacteria bacterium Greene0416_62]|nr:MAG: riboflavin synthase [Candidatus Peregrinibacteria bacterium Greene0416_62]TSC99005.1 MAG: riboflavin synthase [Candidatus Peregrinibacteria bacterium Greene1014_49]